MKKFTIYDLRFTIWLAHGIRSSRGNEALIFSENFCRELSLAPGFSPVTSHRPKIKPLKRFFPVCAPDTGLKAGANERGTA